MLTTPRDPEDEEAFNCVATREKNSTGALLLEALRPLNEAGKAAVTV